LIDRSSSAPRPSVRCIDGNLDVAGNLCDEEFLPIGATD